MINRIQLKMLELLNRLEDQRGQTSAEYVAVTAVAVAIAIGVIYLTLSAALTDAVGDIAQKITDFVATPPSPAPTP